MRIFISILMFVIGLGCVVYSYIGSIVTIASDAGARAEQGDEAGAINMLFDFILAGEVPQLTGFLYGGLLLIAISIVYLIVYNPKKNTKDHDGQNPV